MSNGIFGLGADFERLAGVTGRLPAAERLNAKEKASGHPVSSPYQKWTHPGGDSWAGKKKTPIRQKPARKGRPLTMDDIERMASKNGGFPRKLVTSWGVPWPLVKGWKRRLINGEYD